MVGLGVVGQLLVQLACAAGPGRWRESTWSPRAWSGPGAAGPTLRLTPPDSTPQGVERAVLSVTGGQGADVGLRPAHPAAFPP